MSKFRISYAQNKEDIILSGFFKGQKKGFYVDVGANHPENLSITKIFYDKGWSGINIEPNKHLHELLRQNRPRDINLNIGAADENGKLTLREYPEGDGLSTFSKAAQASYEKDTSEYRKNTRSHKDYEVEVKTLQEVFAEHKVKLIDFMSIDVEGFEYQVIKGNDWDKYRPRVLCIEANHIVKDWRPLLQKAGYKQAFFDGLNNYYVDSKHPELIKNFSYVNTVLLGKPVIPAPLQRNVNELEAQLRILEDRLTRQDIIEESLRAQIHNLYVQREADRRIRALLKQLVASINAAILVQIAKLDKPKLKEPDPIELDENSNPGELSMKIKRYDLERYFGSKNIHPLSYRIVHSSYTGLYGGLKTVARKGAAGLRRLKNV